MATLDMSHSAVVDLTADVNCTIEHLQELGQKIKERQFSSSNCSLIQDISASLKELDAKRQKAHEILEAETIKSSVLRHKLAVLPQKLKSELSAALSSAREVNNVLMLDLQNQLADINTKTARTSKKHEVLVLHNDVLKPEAKALYKKREELMKKVNALMAKKAQMKITLDDTQDKLHETESHAKSIEQDLLKLEEEIKTKRDDFAREKQGLLDKLDKTRCQYSKQLEDNHFASLEANRKEAENVEAMLLEQEKAKRLKAANAKLQALLAQEAEMKAKLVEGDERIKQLLTEGEAIVKHTEEDLNQEHIQRIAGMRERTIQYQKEAAITQLDTDKLTILKKKLMKALKVAEDVRNREALSLVDAKENVQAAKRTLLFHAGESSRLQEEIREAKLRLDKIQDSHKMTAQMLQDQAAVMRDKLSFERRQRHLVEEAYSDLQQQQSKYSSEHSQKMSVLKAQLEQSRDLHSHMSDKEAELLSQIEAECKEIDALTINLEATSLRLNQTKLAFQNEMPSLEESVSSLRITMQGFREALKEVEPQCCQLENEYTTVATAYEVKKKEMIALLNKKAGLEDTITFQNRKLESLKEPQDKLRMDTLKCRAHCRAHIRQYTKEVNEMEVQVAAGNQKTLAVQLENQRIEEALLVLEAVCAYLRQFCESNERSELQAELTKCRETLGTQWGGNRRLQEMYSSMDSVTLGDLATFSKASEERLNQISKIHGHFIEEITKFSAYLSELGH